VIDISKLDKRILHFYSVAFPSFFRLVRNELRDCNSVLDLGCGPDSPLIYSGWAGAFAIGVDIFPKSIVEARQKGFYRGCILADLRSPPFREAKIVDACLARSVLEHLPKEDSLGLLERMENWAMRRVIVVVPNGYCLQEPYDENPFQAHRSSWTPRDLENRGYRTYGLGGYKPLRGQRGFPRFRPPLVWLFVSQLTQLMTHYRPDVAFELGAVKRLD